MADQRTPSIAEQVIGIRQSNATQYNEALRTAFAGVQTNVAILGTALQMKEQGEMSRYRKMHLDRMDEANGAMRDLSESHRSLEEYLKTGGTVPDGIGNNSGKDVDPTSNAPTISTPEDLGRKAYERLKALPVSELSGIIRLEAQRTRDDIPFLANELFNRR
jgi:hypothetical protein